MQSAPSLLRCPLTSSELKLKDGKIRNAKGDVVGELNGTIIFFESRSTVESEAERLSLLSLLQDAKEQGWQNALISSRDPEFVKYVTDERRARFVDCLPIDEKSDVLEIGPGLGQFTVELAKRSRSVFALEVVAEQAAIVDERARQEGASNVQVAAGGADCRLPFGNELFDVVVLNLVLEWCGSRSLESHETMQRRLVQEIVRVLKPGGVAWLSTKNRFGVGYLLGKPDEHFDGMPFGSALPRWLANRLHSRRSSGHLYSYRAFNRMLRANGFEKLETYWAAPEMRFPTHFVRTGTAAIREARADPDLVQGPSKSVKLIMELLPAFLVRHFTPGLTVLARKRAR